MFNPLIFPKDFIVMGLTWISKVPVDCPFAFEINNEDPRVKRLRRVIRSKGMTIFYFAPIWHMARSTPTRTRPFRLSARAPSADRPAIREGRTTTSA
jgi:hypothetical protein